MSKVNTWLTVVFNDSLEEAWFPDAHAHEDLQRWWDFEDERA